MESGIWPDGVGAGGGRKAAPLAEPAQSAHRAISPRALGPGIRRLCLSMPRAALEAGTVQVNPSQGASGAVDRLSFVLPDFTRHSWVGDKARQIWEPRLGRIR